MSRIPCQSWLTPLLIGLVAFGVRLLSVISTGDLRGLLGYDEGVYFSASSGFISGLMPYRDFVLVHPPGVLVALAPFAFIAHFTTDADGWAIARIGVMLLGSLTAVVVYFTARRVSRVAGITAGLLYAVWWPAVHVERTTMLEAFVLVGIAGALWALRDSDVRWPRLVLAGALLGCATSTKLWGAVPLIVVVLWLLLARRWRSALVVTASWIGMTTAIILPFFLLAPSRMFELVMLGQIGRGRGGAPETQRIVEMLNLGTDSVIAHGRLVTLLAMIGTVVMAVLVITCWAKVPRARLWAALLVVQVGVLLYVPVYFAGYSSFIGPALALVVGAVVSSLWTQRGARILIAGFGGIVLLASCYRSVFLSDHQQINVPKVEIAVAGARCVGSDSPGVLIATNALSRDLDNGCPVIFDVDGTVYAIDQGSNPDHLSSGARRKNSAEYQRRLEAYFSGTDAIVMHRTAVDGIDPEVLTRIENRPLLLREPGARVYGR
ncbi:MAG: hypothetical protein RL205_617 [Actinomycetota bacterium]